MDWIGPGWTALEESIGGEAGIRTLGWIAPSIDFESIPFGHSGTSPVSFREIAKSYDLGNGLSGIFQF